MIKKIIILILLAPAVVGIAYYTLTADRLQFESICDRNHDRYTKLCKNVGKNAHSKASVVNLNDKNYGKIIGVAWRRKGSIISSKRQKKKRRSEKNAYYYIIGDIKDRNSQFLRAATETDPR